MPPSTRIGSGSSHLASLTAAHSSPVSNRAAALGICRPIHIACNDSINTINPPGNRPARNRSFMVTGGVVLSWPATKPNRINGNDGANSRPRLPEDVTRPRL
jgi:hypothetical protein